MLDFIEKIDNDAGDAGVVKAEEYNSIFGEAKNVVSSVMALDEASTTQLLKAIDILAKANHYTDSGTANAIVLTRSATSENTETLFDGLTITFSPVNANTGASTLKLNNLDALPLKDNGVALTAGFLEVGERYFATYDETNDWFECYAVKQQVTISPATQEEVNAGAVTDKFVAPDTLAGTKQLAIIEEQSLYNSAALASTAGMNTRGLNTVVYNNLAGASLASNQITLQAGTYEIEALAYGLCGISGGSHRIFLKNITDGTFIATGTHTTSQYDADINTAPSQLFIKFTISSTKTFELQHEFSSSHASGLQANTGSYTNTANKVHARIIIKKG